MAQQTTFLRNLFEGFQMQNLPNAAHGEANHDIVERAKATPAIVQNLAGPLGVYEAAVRRETEATFKDLTDSITKEINEILAPKRNSVETGLKALFRAQEESDDQQVAADARTLSELAHLHRMHTDEKLDAQTDAIRDFCADVEANHAQALANVGGEVLFAKLKAANDAVCDAMMRRFQIEAERETGAMVTARRATDNGYRGLTHCVEAMVYMQGLEPYADYIAFVNQLLKHYKRLYPSAGTGTSNGSGVVGGEGVEGSGSEGGNGSNTGGSTGSGEPTNPSEPSNPGNGGSNGGSGSGGGEEGTVPGGSVAGGSGSGSTETPTDPTKILLLFNDGAHGNVILKRMEVAPGYQLQASDLPDGYVYAFKADDQADIDAASPGDTVWVTLAPRN